MTLFGYLTIALAVGWLLYKMYLAYDSAGGTDMMVTVNDAAIFPPVIGIVGLYLVLGSHDVTWPPRIYIAIWLAATLFAFAVLRVMERLGDRPL